MPRDRTLCYRTVARVECGATWAEHDRVTRACPKLEGGTFRPHVRTPTRVGNSFSGAEADVAAQVIQLVMRGGDCRQLVRSPAFASFARKVLGMGARLREQVAQRKAEKAAQPAHEPEGQAAE